MNRENDEPRELSQPAVITTDIICKNGLFIFHTSFVCRVSKASALRSPNASVATFATIPRDATTAPPHRNILVRGLRERGGSNDIPKRGEDVRRLLYAWRDRHGAVAEET